MKILYVIPFMQVPPKNGLAIRLFNIINYLSDLHEITILSYEVDDQGDFFSWASEGQRDLVSLGNIKDNRSGKRRSLLGTIFQFPPASFVSSNPLKISREIKNLIEKGQNFNLIIFETQNTAQAALLLPKELKKIPKIAVLLDVYSVYKLRKYRSIGFRPYKAIYLLDWLKTEIYERRILATFKHVVVMSDEDARHLRHRWPGQPFVSPNGVDTEFFKNSDTSTKMPPGVIFVGNFNYEPNIDGYKYLLDQIMPMVWQVLPQTNVFLVGINPSDELTALARQDTRIIVTGPVDDLRSWYQKADCAVVPLRMGSGTKLKVLEAFSMSMPVVSTGIGMEGIPVSNGCQAFIAKTPAEFAAKIVEVLRDPVKSREMGAAARVFALDYDWKKISEEFESWIVTKQ